MRSIDELKVLQSKSGLGQLHLVELGEEKFNIAHTDEERAQGQAVMEACALNTWLAGFDGPPGNVGTYVAERAPDGYWILEPCA